MTKHRNLDYSIQDLVLLNYNIACDDVSNFFCIKHNFEKLNEPHTNTFWVADERGGILCCVDYFFGMETILTDLKENATDDELMQYYDYCLETEDNKYNYKNWLCRFARTTKS